MAFVSGLLLIDAPASALNNLGAIEGSMTDNATGVKFIRTREGSYPYVSAQAYRYWLRKTLEENNTGWKAAPIFREQKIAYTDGNPLQYWDDDLFGYMRAPSKKASAVEAREAEKREKETKTTDTITRISPFRVSTLVSIGPVSIVNDFGVMSRHEGDPVPNEHQFYRTTLKGSFSLNLKAAGTFSYKNKTGYLNLDKGRIDEAEKAGLEKLEEDKSYRLSREERMKRISTLLKTFGQVEGGAKQALHYTDVSPDLILAVVAEGGNQIFGHVIDASNKGTPAINTEAFKEAIKVFGDNILSKIYIGWVKGYMEDERSRFENKLNEDDELYKWKENIIIKHPLEALEDLIEELSKNPSWLD